MTHMKSKICEGQNVPHSHLTDALGYVYLKDGTEADLCSRCVAYERDMGFILERTFVEESCPE